LIFNFFNKQNSKNFNLNISKKKKRNEKQAQYERVLRERWDNYLVEHSGGKYCIYRTASLQALGFF